jgi:hypothetical protein
MVATCVGISLLAVAAAAADRFVVEAVLVRVNDRIMTMTDFQQRLQVELSQHEASSTLSSTR